VGAVAYEADGGGNIDSPGNGVGPFRDKKDTKVSVFFQLVDGCLELCGNICPTVRYEIGCGGVIDLLREYRGSGGELAMDEQGDCEQGNRQEILYHELLNLAGGQEVHRSDKLGKFDMKKGDMEGVKYF
jgi:hypothetical protein